MSDTASHRLYLNADKTAVVAEGDPDARFLLAAEGDEIPAEYADLVKKTGKPANKAVKAHEDK